MEDILTIASYTLRRYARKPLVVVLFLGAPLLLFAFLSGSTTPSYITAVKSAPGVSCLKNSFIAPVGGMKTTDRECIAFMLMLLFYFAVASCSSVTNDFENGLNARFKSTPAGCLNNIIGKALGNLALMFGFSVVLIILGKFLFSVSFGANDAVTVAALFLFCVITNSFGILLSGFIRNIYVCCVLDFCVNFPMMYVVMYKILAPVKITPFFSCLSAFSLHNYAENAMVGASPSGLVPLLVIAAVITPMSLIVGRWALK